MRIQWFGESWGAPVCASEDHAETPVGVECLRCEKPIEAGDQGVIMDSMESMTMFWKRTRKPMHLDCLFDDIGIGRNKIRYTLREKNDDDQ